MRNIFLIILLLVTVCSGWYFYYLTQIICPTPLEYSIGEINESFHLTVEDFQEALFDAEHVWEDAIGVNLFTYNPDSPFTVNLIYDNRQAYADAEDSFKEKLDKTQSASDAISQQYTKLVTQYNKLQTEYSTHVVTYEKELDAYNAQVQTYNTQGGVTEEQYERLQERKQDLDKKREVLDEFSKELNTLVQEINTIGDRGNNLVETYNQGVHEYNNTFGESREFTQGTYSSDKRIDIYTYANQHELRLVLAHELGHALSLNHVSNEQSIMYFLIGAQPKDLKPTEEDMSEFIKVCSKKDFWSTIKLLFNK